MRRLSSLKNTKKAKTIDHFTWIPYVIFLYLPAAVMAKTKGRKQAKSGNDSAAASTEATEAVRRITLGEFGATDTSVPPKEGDYIQFFKSY